MNESYRLLFLLSFVLSLVLVGVALNQWGAAEVRGHGAEVSLLTVAAAIWLGLLSSLLPWMGLSLRDDAVERDNAGALIALCGAVLALAVVYAGGSVGEGPSYWNNAFSIFLGTAAFVGLWLLLELAAKPSISITEERDLAAGMRLCGFLLAIGLVLGRAVAGDWHSEAATVHDLARDGWPAALLTVMATIIERFARPNRRWPFPPWRKCGLVPGLSYVAAAFAWLWHLGPWEGMP